MEKSTEERVISSLGRIDEYMERGETDRKAQEKRALAQEKEIKEIRIAQSNLEGKLTILLRVVYGIVGTIMGLIGKLFWFTAKNV